MASAMCQAYPVFLFGYNARSLFISVSENFYEKFIVNQDYCVSNLSSFCPKENCNFHSVSIVSSLDQILRRLDKNHFTYQFVCKNHNYFFYRECRKCEVLTFLPFFQKNFVEKKIPIARLVCFSTKFFNNLKKPYFCNYIKNFSSTLFLY